MKSVLNHLVLASALLFSTAYADEYLHEDFNEELTPESAGNIQDFYQNPKNGQIAVRLNEQGWLRILEMAMKHTAPSSAATFAVPSKVYKFQIKKSMLLSNPILPVIDEITNLGLREGNKNVDFYLDTSTISVTGDVDKPSLKTQFTNAGPNGFDLSVAINLPRITVKAPSLYLCMQRLKGNCDPKNRIGVKNLRISTKSNPVRIRANFRIQHKNNIARVDLLSLKTNLEGSLDGVGKPSLDINSDLQLVIPKIAIEVNGVVTELVDNAKLHDEFLKNKHFLARELMSFAASFSGKNLEQMANVYLLNAQVPTTYQVLNYNSEKVFDELKYEDQFRVPMKKDSSYTAPAFIPKTQTENEKMIAEVKAEIGKAIKKAEASVTLTSTSNPANKDIELHAALELLLNGQKFYIRNSIHNTEAIVTGHQRIEHKPYTGPARDNTYVRPIMSYPVTSPKLLPEVNLTPFRNNDISIAISEPLLNGALELVNSTGLFHKLLRLQAQDNPEFNLQKNNAVRIHFSSDRKITLVANVQVELTDVTGISGSIGSGIEIMQGKSTRVYFPLEVQITPKLQKTADGKTLISLYVESPFTEKGVRNTFKYGSNLKDATGFIRSKIMSGLKEKLEPNFNKWYGPYDLTDSLNQNGLTFVPKSIVFDQAAFMILNVDLKDIKFNALNPKRK